jgi:hypothetical protein
MGATVTTRPAVIQFRRYLYRLIARYLSFFTSEGARILEIGPTTRLLKEAMPARAMVAYRPAAGADYGPSEIVDSFDAAAAFLPDRIVLNGLLHVEEDIQARLEEVHRLCAPSTRVLIVYYSSLWRPLFALARALGLQTPLPKNNWIAPSDLGNLLVLSGFDLVTSQARVLVPVWIPLVSSLVNRWLAPLPGLNWRLRPSRSSCPPATRLATSPRWSSASRRWGLRMN